MEQSQKEILYKIQGIKIDNNPILLTHNNIVWRTNRNPEEIQQILFHIKNTIYNIAKNHNIPTQSISIFQIPNNEKAQEDPHTNSNIQSDKIPIRIKTYPIALTSLNKKYLYKNYKDKLIVKQLYKRNPVFLTTQLLKKHKNRINHSIIHSKFFAKNVGRLETSRINNATKNNSESPYIYDVWVNMNTFVSKNKNWIQEYQQSIQPILCGDFYIHPSWHKQNIQYKNLIIDPSLSFGSGHHATTAMCIEFLSSLHLKNKKLLDVGCGSGILSLVGASLGANVYACDTDPYACNQSHHNFKINKLHYKLIWQGSIKDCSNHDIPQLYDCICANIVSSIILILKNDFIKHLQNQGILILSGILKEHENNILENFSCLKLLEKKQIDEWISLKFIKT